MSNAKLEVTVVLSCTSTGKVSREKVVAPETVDQLQDLIQERFCVPKCLQRLKLEDSTLLMNSQKLTDFYIRSEDSIIVEYLAAADVELITEFCRDLQSVVATFKKLFEASDHINGYSSISDEDHSTVEDVTSLFHTMAYTCLIPWHELPKIEANRQLLNQDSGIRHTIELLSFLLEAPFSSLTDSLQRLLISCLSLMWNFAETLASRCVIIRSGGFQLMLKALLVHVDHSSEESEQFGMFDLFDHAVGCISNYSEVEECQLQLAQDPHALDLLLNFAIHGSSMNVFTKMLVANCVFRLSHSKAVHRYLSQPPVMEKTLQFLASFNRILGLTYYNFVIAYVLSVAIARITLLSFDTIPIQFHSRITELLESFLVKAKARGNAILAAAEEKLQCNWLTVIPFMDIFLTPVVQSDTTTTSSSKPDAEKSTSTRSANSALVENSVSVMMFALNVEMSRKRNRKLLIQQGLLDFMVSLPWIVTDRWRDSTEVIIADFQNDLRCLPVPKLRSIAAMHVARQGIPLGHVTLFSK